MNYVATSHKPSKVTHTAVGWFLGGAERSLLVARVTRVEVLSIGANGLAPVTDLPVYGRVCAMELFRAPGYRTDHLLFVTEKYQLAVVRWDAASAMCVTVLTCDVRDTMGSPVLRNLVYSVDPGARCVALHQYQHMLKIVPTSMSREAPQAFNVRLYEADVLDVCFLHNAKDKPVIAVLSRDTGPDDAFHLKTYVVSPSLQEITEGPLCKQNLESPASNLVPVPAPCGGVLIMCEQCVYYVNVDGGNFTCVSTAIQPALVKAVGAVDANGARYLVGDHLGKLSMLVLEIDPETSTVLSLAMEMLGETSIPCAISYLDKGYVYIGSDYGDSQLIKLNSDRNPETQQHIDVVATYPNIGPVTDFCIVRGAGCTRHGQGQLVTCSGAMHNGSLRVIRNGIGISEQAAVELPGIKDMWSLRRHYGERYHSYLIQSFASETRVLELIGADEMAPATLPNIDEDATTLFAGNFSGDLIAQVTASSVRVLDCVSMAESPTPAWSPPAATSILVATGNPTQLLLGLSGGTLVYLTVDTERKTLVESSRMKSENEIACLNCNPLGPLAEDGTCMSSSATVAAVGLWADLDEQPVVRLVALPTLTEVCTVTLENDVMARSVLLATLEDRDYFLIALGDGHILSYVYKGPLGASSPGGDVPMVAATGVEDGSGGIVAERRRLNVGTLPASLSLFRSNGSNNIFAACDRPTVVYAERGGGRLLVSSVNLEQVNRVCAFDTEAFPDCLAIATEESLTLGAVDEIQKLHMQTIPLGQQARRIAHVESARAMVVLTEGVRVDEFGNDILDCYVCLLDDSTFESLDQVKLRSHEVCASLIVTKLEGDGIDEDVEYVVVGTGDAPAGDVESKSGRILLFTVKNKSLQRVGQVTARGVTYCLRSLGDRLLAGVESMVIMYSFSKDQSGDIILNEEFSFRGHVVVLRLEVRGDFILVGDLMRSVTLLRRRNVGGDGLEMLAQDYDSAWTIATEILGDDTFVIAEMSKNIMTLKRNSQAASDKERLRLDRVGLFHLGALVNKIQHGSLVAQMGDDAEMSSMNSLIFATADGMLGVILSMDEGDYELFSGIQKAMAQQLPGIGGLDHDEWRQFVTDTPPRSTPAAGYIDGDLVEMFLELPPNQMTQVAMAVGHSVDKLTRRIEAMQRLH